jgi:hypothetical protein
MIRILLAATFAFACMSLRAEEALPAALPPAEEASALVSAQSVGVALYRHDRAAWVATDAARAVPQFKEDRRVNGWITEQSGSDIVVTFLDATPAALYRVSVTDGKAGPVLALEAPTPLSAYEAGAAAARSLAIRTPFQLCSKDYNPVVLPGSTPAEDWVVYLIPGTTKSTVVPIGGAYRFAVKDSRVVSQRGFTRSCIDLENGPRAVGLFITHVLDSVPTEVHVFWSLVTRKPIYVATAPAGSIWMVHGGKIMLSERKSPGG